MDDDTPCGDWNEESASTLTRALPNDTPKVDDLFGYKVEFSSENTFAMTVAAGRLEEIKEFC